MKTNYTAGPWRVGDLSDQESPQQVWSRYDDTPGSRNNFVVADDIQSEADARLIAAAPELVEALRDCVKWLGDPPAEDDGFMDAQTVRKLILKTRAVLARVSGEVEK